MRKSSFERLVRDEYDALTEEDRITSINTIEKPDYSPLDMRDDEISASELLFLCTPTTVGFKGKYSFLSNMSYAPFEMKGHWFLSAEHAFHFWKCKYADEAKKFEAGNKESIDNPYEARKAGRKVVMRDNWNKIRISVMRAVVRAKFDQNEQLMEKLIEMPGSICEYNDWGDAFWGVTLQNGKWVGENNLGKILTDLRNDYLLEEELENWEINFDF